LKTLLIVLMFIAQAAFAEEKLPVNYCHDEGVNADWEKMLADTPEDPLIIKLYGLRVGLCRMIDEGKVSLEQGIEIWNQEHAKSVNQRSGEEEARNKEFTL
jgi:hypothetical protein